MPRNATVLVVEDDALLRETLADYLAGDMDLEVVTASSGEEAQSYLRQAQEPPSLLLVDLMLPEMSGVDLVRWIRESGSPSRSAPVVIMTGHPAEARSLVGELAAERIHVKPLNMDDLIDTVATYC